MKSSLYKSLLLILLITISSCSKEEDKYLLISVEETIHFEASGTEANTVDIVSNIEFEVFNDCDWIEANISKHRSDTTTITLHASPNTGKERNTYIRISSQELEQVINITQRAINIVVDFDYEDNIDHYKLINKSYSIPASPVLNFEWTIKYKDTNIEYSEDNCFTLPFSESNCDEVNIELSINSNGQIAEKAKLIPIPKSSWYRVYSIGKQIDKYIANNVDYNWYIDQNNTGKYSDINCGPACATMALKWAYPDFSFTVEDARNAYMPNGGWWSTATITQYLKAHNGSYGIIHFNDSRVNDLIADVELDNGNIAILCLDIYYVRTQTKGEEWELDKFYRTQSNNSGHFIIIKGYVTINNQIFFEVYDPWSLGRVNKDGKPLSCDRLYRKDDIVKASNLWWRYAIVIRSPKKSIRSFEDRYILDIENIPVQWGK